MGSKAPKSALSPPLAPSEALVTTKTLAAPATALGPAFPTAPVIPQPLNHELLRPGCSWAGQGLPATAPNYMNLLAGNLLNQQSGIAALLQVFVSKA